MMNEELQMYLITLLPAVTAIFGIITAVVRFLMDNKKMMKQFQELRNDVNETTNVLALKKEIDELKQVCYAVMEENIQLKKTINKTVATQNNIHQEGDSIE